MLIVPVDVQSKDVPVTYSAISDTFQIIRVDHKMHLEVTFCFRLHLG